MVKIILRFDARFLIKEEVRLLLVEKQKTIYFWHLVNNDLILNYLNYLTFSNFQGIKSTKQETARSRK